jgi:hypothetical protein
MAAVVAHLVKLVQDPNSAIAAQEMGSVALRRIIAVLDARVDSALVL